MINTTYVPSPSGEGQGGGADVILSNNFQNQFSIAIIPSTQKIKCNFIVLHPNRHLYFSIEPGIKYIFMKPNHLKILVCIKGILEHQSISKIDYRMNRFDEYAVEEAILIKEAHPNCEIHLLTVGPSSCSSVLKRGIGMGADNATHIVSEHDNCLNPFFIAECIVFFAKNKHYDLIFTGVMSEDTMFGMTGQFVAEFLKIPCATSVIYEKVDYAQQRVYVEREIGGGAKDTLELILPAVLTFQSGINTPRYPALSKMLRACKMTIPSINSTLIKQSKQHQKIVHSNAPQKSRAGIVLKGSLEEKARHLIEIFHDKSLLLC